jgi:hypothetical protein
LGRITLQCLGIENRDSIGHGNKSLRVNLTKNYGGDGMIGLKRGQVELCDHQNEWKENATVTIN